MPLDFPNTPTDGQVYDNYYWDAENGVWNSLGNYDIPNILSNGVFTASSGTTVPLTAVGASGQSANLQEWKSQAGATLASMSAIGGLTLNNALTIANGGTGATDSATARTNLAITPANIGAAALSHNHDASNITSGRLDYGRLPSGTIIQVAHTQTATKSVIRTQDLSAVPGAAIDFTPKFANSTILAQSMVTSDSFYVASFGFLQNGNSVYGGSNTNSYGAITTIYKGDSGSSSHLWNNHVSFSWSAGSTTARTIQLGATSSWGGTLYDLQINNRGSNDMSSVTTLTVMEIIA